MASTAAAEATEAHSSGSASPVDGILTYSVDRSYRRTPSTSRSVAIGTRAYVIALLSSALLCVVTVRSLSSYLPPSVHGHDELLVNSPPILPQGWPSTSPITAPHGDSLSPVVVATQPVTEAGRDGKRRGGSSRSSKGLVKTSATNWNSLANALGGFSTSFVHSPQLNVSWIARPAGFGPRIVDSRGLQGRLEGIEKYASISVAHDIDEARRGCSISLERRYLELVHRQQHGSAWRHEGGPADDDGVRIALVQRGGCPFVTKLLNAQALNYTAVIVYNDPAHAISDSPNAVLSTNAVAFEDNRSSSSERDAASVAGEHNPRVNMPGLNEGFGGGIAPRGGMGFPDEDELISMWSPSRESMLVKIPSVFVAYSTGRTLDNLARIAKDHEETFTVVMEPEDPPHLLLMDLIIMLFFLPTVFTTFVIVLTRVRQIRHRKKMRAPRSLVDSLPSFKWSENLGSDIEALDVAEKDAQAGSSDVVSSAGDKRDRATSGSSVTARIISKALQIRTSAMRPLRRNSDGDSSLSTTHTTISSNKARILARKIFAQRECAICLSDFITDEVIRLLPCGHIFHLSEIDAWLTNERRWCPVCRCPIDGDRGDEGVSIGRDAVATGTTATGRAIRSTPPSPTSLPASGARPIITREDIEGATPLDHAPIASSSTSNSNNERTPLLRGLRSG